MECIDIMVQSRSPKALPTHSNICLGRSPAGENHIALLITFGDHPRQSTTMIMFYVVDAPSP